MKAAIHVSKSRHQHIHAEAMAACLKRHGIHTETFVDNPPPQADFLVFWGWRKARLYRARGHECLIMERGYLGDRFSWTSLGWNGLNGNASFNPAFDTGERLNKHYGNLIQPWKPRPGPVVLMGQVPGDAALFGVDIVEWTLATYSDLVACGYDVEYRHHPLAKPEPRFNALIPSIGDLKDALLNAQGVVTYNSNTGVDSVVNGVPAITLDKGAMAWPVTSHDLNKPFITPHRHKWLIDLSWRQWTLDEITNGDVWQFIKPTTLKEKKYSALVLGGGPNVWAEAEQAFTDHTIDYVIAINNCIQDYPGRIDMAVTLHPFKLKAWLEERNNRNYVLPRHVIAHKQIDGVTQALPYLWPEMKYSGSSGLFAVKAALELLKVDKVILAGVPMTNDPHYHKGDKKWNDCGAFMPAWKAALPRIKDRVRSYSGMTAIMLGEPTKEWIND